jgi:hypothetical protein
MTAPFVFTSPTSAEAARLIDPAATSLKAKVFRYVVERGERGATDDETQIGLPMTSHTQVPRRIDLVKAGLVVDSGLVRKTRAGRDACVWIDARLVEADDAQRRLF